MDLVPRSKSISAPTETRGYRDQNAALARDLAPIAQITGQAVAPKTLKGDFLGLGPVFIDDELEQRIDLAA